MVCKMLLVVKPTKALFAAEDSDIAKTLIKIPFEN